MINILHEVSHPKFEQLFNKSRYIGTFDRKSVPYWHFNFHEVCQASIASIMFIRQHQSNRTKWGVSYDIGEYMPPCKDGILCPSG